MNTMEQMNQLVTDARELMGQMKLQNEINKNQIDSMNKEMERHMALFQRYYDIIANTVKTFRNIAIVFVTLIVVPAVIGGFTLEKRVSETEESIDEQKVNTMNSIDIVVEGQNELFEEVGVSTEELDKSKKKIRDGVKREMGFVSRSAKVIDK